MRNDMSLKLKLHLLPQAVQQIHNISTRRDVVQQIERIQQVHKQSTTNRVGLGGV